MVCERWNLATQWTFMGLNSTVEIQQNPVAEGAVTTDANRNFGAWQPVGTQVRQDSMNWPG